MTRSSDQYQLIVVDGNGGKPGIFHRHGNNAKVNALVDHGFRCLRRFSTLNADGNFRILAFEICKDLRKYVQASGLVGPDHDLSTRCTVHFRNRRLKSFE